MAILMTGRFWAATVERAARTAAQTAVATIGVNVVAVQDVNWPVVAGAAGLGALLSVLTSVGASATSTEGPSFGPEELKPPESTG
jgi:hypothetical protein